MKIFKKENINNIYKQINPISRYIRTHFIAVYRLLSIFQNFSPFRIIAFTAFAVLQGVRGSLLQLHALRPRKRDFANSTCNCGEIGNCRF
jgi:hypothetical protein